MDKSKVARFLAHPVYTYEPCTNHVRSRIVADAAKKTTASFL